MTRFVLIALLAIGTTLLVLSLVNTKQSNVVPVLGVQNTQTRAIQRFADITTKIPTPVPHTITMESIFQYEDPATLDRNDSQSFMLMATGDIIPARSVNAACVSRNDFTYPFTNTATFLSQADAVFINLESPFISACPVTTEGMKFCGDERNVEGLSIAHVTVANIANNHMGNYGVDGIENTKGILSNNSIEVTGSDEAAILQKNGYSFGFLGYNDIGGKEQGIAWADPEKISADIQKLKPSVDFVIVTFHWGTEYTQDPTKRQRELAHGAIDTGADLIIGNHPHWVQGTENYKGKFITYAHGNFVFDQMWSQETREGVIGTYIFSHLGIIDIHFYPIIIDNYSQPRFATEEEAQRILDRMKASSDKILRESV
jgi:poly-gamma-glutamate capsule biosynthesis protein CapA/YwtB (metallophosphatase superfamily)